MKRLYAALVATVACVVFAEPAIADPGNTWDKVLTAGRFKVLSDFNNEAVSDKETGRVWEQSPNTTTRDWTAALAHCYTLEIGGRKGWRLPTIEELASLVDTSQPAPTLPADNPFSNVLTSDNYQSATTDAISTDNSLVWGVNFLTGGLNQLGKTNDHLVWCVRDGQGIDGVH